MTYVGNMSRLARRAIADKIWHNREDMVVKTMPVTPEMRAARSVAASDDDGGHEDMD